MTNTTGFLTEIKEYILQVVCRFASNLINEMHGFQEQSEPDSIAALRQSLTKHQLRERAALELRIDNAIQNEHGSVVAMLQEAICEGMNIECKPEMGLKDLFMLLDASISSRSASDRPSIDVDEQGRIDMDKLFKGLGR